MQRLFDHLSFGRGHTDIHAWDARTKVLSLGELTPLRFAVYQQWHDLVLGGPTKSVTGERSNDFPGLYYYDPRTQTEHVIMVQGPIDWRFATLERRIGYVGGEEGTSKQHLMVGLFSERDLDGSIELKHEERHRPLFGNATTRDRDVMPDQWEALDWLTSMSFKLLPLETPGPALDWEDAAMRCLERLLKIRHESEREGKALWVFFDTFDTVWDGTKRSYQQRPDKEYPGSAELLCQVGLAGALLDYARTDPRKASEYRELGLALASNLADFYDERCGIFQNTYPPRGEEWSRGVVDTWYMFHNLYQVLRVAGLAADRNLENLALKSVDRMVTFVRACNYQIPLFAKLAQSGEDDDADGTVIGFALNPSVLGMYAAVLVAAAEKLAERPAAPADKAQKGLRLGAYRDEALKALKSLRRWPIRHMHHETVQLSWAASAAHALQQNAWRDDFTRCLLLSCYRQGEHAGLFQGCAGLSYPTFRETVEGVEWWVPWLNDAPAELPLRQILGLVLQKAQRFLVTQGRAAGLPREGLATVEQPEGGKVGVAIYAAAQVFELARLQRQLRLR